MKLEYVYNNEWKELKKQKKYEEAAKCLKEEVKYNLARVHNCFSDLKIKAEYGNTYIGLNYTKNNEGKLINDLNEFLNIKHDIIGGAYYDELEWEDEEKYNPRDRLKSYEKTQKELIKLFKKRLNK